MGRLRARRFVKWLTEEGFFVTVVRAGFSDRTEKTDFGELITIRDPLRIYADRHTGEKTDRHTGEKTDQHTAAQKDQQAGNRAGGHSGHQTDEQAGNEPESNTPDEQSDDATCSGQGDSDSEKRQPEMRRVIRKPNRLRRLLAYLLFVPDLTVRWSRRVAKHPLVTESASGADRILASSPPESPFLAASALARKYNARFIMDMRDGWLDEPLKPLLRTSAIQRFRERRLERRMVASAGNILVTSDSWKQKLLERYPFAAGRTMVLTNAYPEYKAAQKTDSAEKNTEEQVVPGRIRFLYAGRLFSSGPQREVEHLLEPLETVGGQYTFTGQLIFLGDLVEEEKQLLNQWADRFQQKGWTWKRAGSVSHELALKQMRSADVLLLLSASQSAIPAKFFDYIAVGKPVLAACPAGSALDAAGREVSQFYQFDPSDEAEATETTARLVRDVLEHRVAVNRPERFEPRYLKNRFLSIFKTSP